MDLEQELVHAFECERKAFGFFYHGEYVLEGLPSYDETDFHTNYVDLVALLKDFGDTLQRLKEQGISIKPDHFRTELVDGEYSNMELMPTTVMEGKGIIILESPYEEVINTLKGEYGIVEDYNGSRQFDPNQESEQTFEINRIMAGVGGYYKQSLLLLDPEEYVLLKGKSFQCFEGKQILCPDDPEFNRIFEAGQQQLLYIKQPQVRNAPSAKRIPINNFTIFESGSEHNRHALAKVIADYYRLRNVS